MNQLGSFFGSERRHRRVPDVIAVRAVVTAVVPILVVVGHGIGPVALRALEVNHAVRPIAGHVKHSLAKDEGGRLFNSEHPTRTAARLRARRVMRTICVYWERKGWRDGVIQAQRPVNVLSNDIVESADHQRR